MLNKFKIFLLLLGDIIALYFVLFLMLIMRYGWNFYNEFSDRHFLPFTIISALWVIIFYIAGLYDIRNLRNNLDFLKTLWLTLLINSIVAVFFFYLIPVFGITPKTNLFIFVALFAAIELFWRRYFNHVVSSGEAPNKVLFVGGGDTTQIVCDTIASNPQLGYEIKIRLDEEAAYRDPQNVSALALTNNLNLIVIPRHLKNNSKLTGVLYELLGRGVEIRDLTNFYELIMKKVPVADLEETWFLENLIGQKKFYEQLKRGWEFLAALIIFLILLPLEALITLIVKITSSGPVIYKQVRVGERGRHFVLYKFRTMIQSKNHDWPSENDHRITGAGKILRRTHLDELPQLINIMKGDISFVGPRPDFKDYFDSLKNKIPYYGIRTLIKPGVTGWAQINLPITASLEETRERLSYDLYYIKNRSLALDLLIILKTIKTVLTASGR